MRGMVALALAAWLLAACSEELTPEEQARQDERDIAMVERANEAMPPRQQVTPEPLLYPDLERHDLYGEACVYAPGTSLGTRVFAREADAFVKIDGEVERLAADPGSRELPMHTRSVYNSKGYSLVLALKEDGGDAEPAPEGDSVSVIDSAKGLLRAF